MNPARLLLLWLLCCFAEPGLAKDIVFSHYKLGRGLPASIIMQDRQGYLWIASDGLIKFDGVAIKHFIADPKQLNAIANNSIRSISEAPDGTLWISSYGISHYSPATDKFTNYTRNATSNADANIDNTVYVDKSGNVWCGNRHGIARFDEKRKAFDQYDLTQYQHAAEPGGSFITCIIQDRSDDGWLWLGTYNGLVHFRKKDGFAVYYYFSKHYCIIDKLLMDSHNRLWVATWGSGLGLFIPAAKQFLFRDFTKDAHDGTTNIVHDLCEQPVDSSRSKFYLCTEKGLIVFEMNKDVKEFQSTSFNDCYTHSASQPESMGGSPQGIMIDRQGIIWVGTDKDLSYILPANQVFAGYPFRLGMVYGINEGSNEAGQPIYWISAWYNNGLTYIDTAFRHITRVHYFDKLQHSVNSRQINSVIETGPRLWVATMGGLFRYDKAKRKASVFLKNNGLPDNRICALCYDHRNKLLWAGTYSKGLFLFDPATQKVVSLPMPVPAALSSGRIYTIYEDSKGNIWLGDDDILYRFNERNFNYKTYKHIAGDLNSKAGGSVTSITEDAQHRVWIATQQGLNLYNRAGDDFSLFTTSDGLSNNNVNSLAVDSGDNLWIATARGLDCMNTKDFSVKSYYNENGLTDDANLNCLLANSFGSIIIGGNDLLNVFRPDQLIKNMLPPRVRINNLKINNTRQLFIINGNNKTIRLRYNQNYFTVDFVALSFINAADNQYAYQLQGVDKDFVYAGSMHSATYANIEPGTYVFKVKAANNDGVWNNAGVSIMLIIDPPFWKTWWFIALCILVLLLAAYALYNYRVNQLLQLERLRTKISTDLHDEIGSTLSAISILSSMAVRQKDTPRTEAMLEEIKESAADLLQKMDDIVWSINPKNDSLENLLLRTRTFAIRLFDASHIGYDIDIPEDITMVKLSMERRQHLYLIIKESINNIVKHADSTFVKFIVRNSNHDLSFFIQDNGKGFDTAQLSYGNGLLSLKNRAKLIHAQLTVSSALGAGTTITLKIKII